VAGNFGYNGSMELSKGFRTWFAQREVLVIFIMLAILLGIFQMRRELPQLQNSHVLGSSTHQVDVLWSTQDIFTKIASNGSGVIYAMPYTGDSLKAIDISKGATKWEIALPLERGGGADTLLTDQDAVFVLTSTELDAYKVATGELKWSTKLGSGHVSKVAQLDLDSIRVYYGDNLYEVDKETGNILSALPKYDMIWRTGNIVFQETPDYKLSAFDKQSGNTLWTNNPSFYVREGQEPINIDKDSLVVGVTKGICTLNIHSGKYSWCHPEIYISDMAIDYQSQLGYAMREDLVLLTIDLRTGNVLGETRFLSSKPIDKQIGFMSSITFSNGVVVISFSDSGQTFGLSLSQSSKK
jgi:outer membrane protein assembly factor BamB